MLKKVSLVILIALLMGMGYSEAGLRYNVTDNLSVGVDNGSAISLFDFKETKVYGGYTVPVVLYEFDENSGILKDYDVSFDIGGVATNTQDESITVDSVAGFGTNAPKVAIQYLMDKTVNKVVDKDITIPDNAKIGLLYKLDTSELLDNGKVEGSLGLSFGWKF